MLHNRFFSFFLLLLLLSGCTTPPKPVETVNTSNHQLKLANWDKWQINGRMAFKSSEDKFSANLRWQQDKQEYAVKFTSTLGISLMEMQGSSHYATLTADDETYRDSNASDLIKRITGWNIPIQQLPTWIKGQYLDNDQPQLDSNGLVATLIPVCHNCDQWQIKYSKYRLVDEIWLPHQIELKNQVVKENQIKIRISSWKKR